MSLASPRVAVILPVYNAEKYIADAIRSVLGQTFTDLHLIVIDDGSTDRSGAIIDGFSDPRLRLIRLAANRGLVTALNTGIAQSASEFIARMDADDVSLPRRFDRQVAFLDSHPDVMMCGTWTRQFGFETGVRRPPVEPPHVRARLFFGFAISHPSIMMRRAFLDHHDLRYREECRHVEDYDLFLRAAAIGDLANLPEVLLQTHRHGDQVSVVHVQKQRRIETRLKAEQLRRLLPDATDEDAVFHAALLEEETPVPEFPRAEQWLVRLGEANRAGGLYDVKAFDEELYGAFNRLHARADVGLAEIRAFWRSPLASASGRRAADTARLCARAVQRLPRRLGRVVFKRV